MSNQHPAWLTPGIEVDVVSTLFREVVGRRREKVARATPTLVVLDTGEKFKDTGQGTYREHPAPRKSNHRKYLAEVVEP